MNFYSKLIISLALVSGIAAGLLSFTYTTTKPVIVQREKEDRVKALRDIFFLQVENAGGKVEFKLEAKEIGEGVTALYDPGQPDKPRYFAVVGQGVGYNSNVPIQLMVGFTSEQFDARDSLKGYVDDARLPDADVKGEFIVGFSVLKSEETPGLGERVKDKQPPYTWAQYFSGNVPPANPDKATLFQRQFRGNEPAQMALKKNGGDLDAITASTITSNAVLAAMQDAGARLTKALNPSS